MTVNGQREAAHVPGECQPIKREDRTEYKFPQVYGAGRKVWLKFESSAAEVRVSGSHGAARLRKSARGETCRAANANCHCKCKVGVMVRERYARVALKRAL